MMEPATTTSSECWTSLAGRGPVPNEGADFNGDGLTDFAVGNAGNDLVSVFLADGEGWFELGSNIPSGPET